MPSFAVLPSRMSASRTLAAAALCLVVTTSGVDAQSPSGAGGPKWSWFETPDGRRTLLVDIGPGAPIAHWARASLVGPGEDPEGLPGLALACLRASFEDIGLIPSVPGLDAGDARPSAGRVDDWRAALAACPASGPRLLETVDGAVVSWTTPVEAAGRLARLLGLRDRGARLRAVGFHLAAVQAEAGLQGTDPLAPLRQEILGLAYLGARRLPDVALPGSTDPEVDPTRARLVWQRTQAPRRTLDVVVGPVEPATWTELLRAEAEAISALDPRAGEQGEGDAAAEALFETPSPPAPVRSGRFRSRLPGLRDEAPTRIRAAVGLAFPLGPTPGAAKPRRAPDDTGPGEPVAPPAEVLDHLEAWLGGREGALATHLRTVGLETARVEVQGPFPGNRRPGLLLVEAWLPTAPPPLIEPGRDTAGPARTAADVDGGAARAEALERALLDALQKAAADGPSALRLRALDARARADHVRMLADPALLAEELALRCGILGATPDAVLAPPDPVTTATLTAVVAALLAADDRITVTMGAR